METIKFNKSLKQTHWTKHTELFFCIFCHYVRFLTLPNQLLFTEHLQSHFLKWRNQSPRTHSRENKSMLASCLESADCSKQRHSQLCDEGEITLTGESLKTSRGMQMEIDKEVTERVEEASGNKKMRKRGRKSNIFNASQMLELRTTVLLPIAIRKALTWRKVKWSSQFSAIVTIRQWSS